MKRFLDTISAVFGLFCAAPAIVLAFVFLIAIVILLWPVAQLVKLCTWWEARND